MRAGARIWWLPVLAMLCVGVPAPAAVTLTFYSKEPGARFPHAFITVTGATDAEPARAIDANYGFTARHISPAVLMGPVHGEIMGVDAGYVRHAQPHLAMTLSDAQYATVMATVETWRTLPGKSDDLNRRNCVFFVGDVARSLGLTVADPPALMKKPRFYLLDLVRRNPGVGTVPADRADATPVGAPAPRAGAVGGAP